MLTWNELDLIFMEIEKSRTLLIIVSDQNSCWRGETQQARNLPLLVSMDRSIAAFYVDPFRLDGDVVSSRSCSRHLIY